MAKRKPVDYSGLANLELRADIEKYMLDNPLARLGWAETDYGNKVIKILNNPTNVRGLSARAAHDQSFKDNVRGLDILYRQAVKEGMDPDAIKTIMYSARTPKDIEKQINDYAYKVKTQKRRNIALGLPSQSDIPRSGVEGKTPQELARRKAFETLVHELMHEGIKIIRPEQDEHHAYIYSDYEYPKLDATSTPLKLSMSLDINRMVNKAYENVRKGKPKAIVTTPGYPHYRASSQSILNVVTGLKEEAEQILADRGVPTTKHIIHAQDEPVDDVKMTPSHMIDILKRLTLPRLW